MSEGVRVSDARYTPASETKAATGLLGYTSFLIDGRIRVDGVRVRRTREGRLTLSFPTHEDHNGRKHSIVHPVDDETRVAIERAVFAALGFLGVKP